MDWYSEHNVESQYGLIKKISLVIVDWYSEPQGGVSNCILDEKFLKVILDWYSEP